MERRAIILDFIKKGDFKAFRKWAQAFPVIEQPDIIREFVEAKQDLEKLKGNQMSKELTEKIQQTIEKFEEIILDQQLASLKFDLLKKQQDDGLKSIKSEADNLRAYIKLSLETDAPDSRYIYILALKLIDIEKKEGIYDEENWWWFEV